MSALFLSAFLAFSLQPMVGKMVLPLLGGAPAVWTTCLLFFQAVLLAGYAWVHFLVSRLSPGRQLLVHIVVLCLPLFFLPITLAVASPPAGVRNPTFWLLVRLTLLAALPFFAVTTTAPLLQKWFVRTGHPDAPDPYFLYAASNLGSLSALLAYPFLLEWILPLSGQSRIWSLLYGLAVIAIVISGVIASRRKDIREVSSTGAVRTNRSTRTTLRWIWYAFLPSSLLLGVTQYITTDIAVIPLLWVIPLALYLLTFVLVFARRTLLSQRLVVRIFAAALIPLVLLLIIQATRPVALVYPLHLVTFFLAAMLCHGELHRSRPPAEDLTRFYVWIAAGGAIGGLFNALVAPLLFTRVLEYPLALLLLALTIPGAGVLTRRNRRRFGYAVGGILAAGMIFWGFGRAGRSIHARRSFFGVSRVIRYEQNEHTFTSLVHGTTRHGLQNKAESQRATPLLYFHPSGPAGDIMSVAAERFPSARVGVIGLGAGTLAAYGTRDQRWTFFEIDPAVAEIAVEPRFFSYLSDCKATWQIVLGDGRISIAERAEGAFDLIVLDAYGSDAIPVHTITREAVALYMSRLSPDGLLAFHISNTHVDLEPVLGALSRSLGWVSFIRVDDAIAPEDQRRERAASTWVVLASRAQNLAAFAADPQWRVLGTDPATRLWTDDYSNLLGAIRW